MTPLLLVPQPRSLTPHQGELTITGERFIVLDGESALALQPIGRRLQELLAAAGGNWQLTAGNLELSPEIGAVLRVDPAQNLQPQGYTLTISPEGIEILAHDPAGLFYGVVTLEQIVAQSGRQLPALQINDWPDFPNRGVMLDISRDKVPTLETLYQLIDLLASWKVNQFQLYTEHTFAFRDHREVWQEASPITSDEILLLDAFCRERFVELVPNQNTFGHMARWLKHPRYASLAETHDTFDLPWGGQMKGPFSLCPGDPDSIKLVHELLAELNPLFSSPQINIGCDETFDLGQGRSREVVQQRGVGPVYLDFLRQVLDSAQALGRTPQFWGDIIMEHPELVGELPQGVIALEWGYEATHPFAEHGAKFAASGIPFYVCPGTSSWNTIAGRTSNALGNLQNAAEHGLKNGAIGYLNTDWGDNGHWQQLPISYLGYLAGAAYSWAWEANRELDVAAALSLHAFHDQSGSTGRMAYDLGNVYHFTEIDRHNSTALFWLLQLPLEKVQQHPAVGQLDGEALHRTIAAIDAAIEELDTGLIDRPDAALIGEEFVQAANLMRHACQRGLLITEPERNSPERRAALAEDLQQLIAQQRKLWLARSRPGGLEDSINYFSSALQDYSA